MTLDYIAEKPEDSSRLATLFSKYLKKPALILLNGAMGAGKTFFVKEFTKATGSSAHTSSPTFSIINLYDSPKGKIYHLDLFRLNDFDELYSIGFDDILNEEAVIFIEWPEIAELDEADFIINIEDLGDNRRSFRVESEKHNLDNLKELLNGK